VFAQDFANRIMVTHTERARRPSRGLHIGSTRTRKEWSIIKVNNPYKAPRSVIVPQIWADFYTETNIPAAVSSDGVLRLTGHTGEVTDGSLSADPETQIRQVFRNIEVTLAEAGVEWSDVVEINSYHVGLLHQTETVLKVAAEFLDPPYPAWTAVGISELIYPEAIIEISCVAVFPKLH
jgi:enamine deaminase RidA (YjgF/YER057c/UK114 family)